MLGKLSLWGSLQVGTTIALGERKPYHQGSMLLFCELLNTSDRVRQVADTPKVEDLRNDLSAVGNRSHPPRRCEGIEPSSLAGGCLDHRHAYKW